MLCSVYIVIPVCYTLMNTWLAEVLNTSRKHEKTKLINGIKEVQYHIIR